MIDKLMDLGKDNGIKLEVLIQKNKMKRIKIFNNEIDDLKISDTVGYNIKSLYKGKYLSTYVTNLDNLQDIIDIIKRNTEISDNEEASEFAKPIEIEAKKINEIKFNLNDIKNYLLGLNDLKTKYKYIDSIESGFSFNSSERNVVNELVNLHDDNQSVITYVEFTLRNGDKVENIGVEDYNNKFDPERLNKKMFDKLEDGYRKLDSVVPENSITKILLTNEVLYGILDCFLNVFYAKSIRLKVSPLVDKLNKKIFSDKITIIEEPSNTKMITSCLFDGEGTKTYYKEIVKNGVFNTILYNNKEAILANTKSTGNSSGVKNCYIKPGDKSFKEMIKIMGNGIIIDRVDGLNAGIKQLTGEISLNSQGYVVKDGKKQEAIKMFIMTTNIFELLSNVIEVGNDLEFIDSQGGSPSILVENINISGK